MLDTTPVMVFAATRDAARARVFYQSKLGLRFVADEPTALVFNLAGTELRIQKVDSFTPHPFTALGWQVSDLQRKVAGLLEAGVVFERYPGMEQDANGVWTAPDGARIVWFKDPDGNTLSLTER
ncbi:VOC family protein [soil metagenome]